METIGTDVVELTGDHFGDYGPEAMLLHPGDVQPAGLALLRGRG